MTALTRLAAILRCNLVEDIVVVANTIEADHRKTIADKTSRNANHFKCGIDCAAIMPFGTHSSRTVAKNKRALASNATKVLGFDVGQDSATRQFAQAVLERWREKHELVAGFAWSCIWFDFRVNQA